MRLDSLVFELYAWGGRETVAELRWRLQRTGHRLEVKVAKQGLQSLGGGCNQGLQSCSGGCIREVAELGWGLQGRGRRVGVGVAKNWSLNTCRPGQML